MQSGHTDRVAFALDQLLGAETLLEQYAKVEILCACMDYVTEQPRWPTPEEIAAITGIGIDHVMEVEERLGGTYEFALRAGFIDGLD
jgi:hypothetical protein